METNTENTQTMENNETVDTQQTSNEALFEKIDEIVNKRMDGIAKNIMKENGVTDDSELKNLFNEYKTHKSNKTKGLETQLDNLRKENAALSQQIKADELARAYNKAANELGISEANLKYVAKLADSSTFEKDGHYDVEAIKTSFASVLNDLPSLKNDKKDEGSFVKVGGKKTEETTDDVGINKYRKLLGLNEIKK